MKFLARLNLKVLYLVIGLTILVVLLELAGPDDLAFRLVPGLLLALVLPGYALTRAIAPQKPFSSLELAFYSLGLSLVAAILSGLLLNLSSGGLNTLNWSLWLGALTLAASIYALTIAPKEESKPRFKLGLHPWQFLILFAAIGLVIGGFYYSVSAAERPPEEGTNFSQFWLVPSATLETGEAQVVVGITNQQTQAQNYNVRLLLNGNKINSWDHLTLQPGQSWKSLIEIPRAATSNPNQAQLVQANLYLSSKPDQVFRAVNLQVNS